MRPPDAARRVVRDGEREYTGGAGDGAGMDGRVEGTAPMPTPVTMPQLGESVTEGTVARWLKREGERVERDEPLLEIVTDKVNADLPSPVAGVLVQRMVEEGTMVPVGATIARIEEHAGEQAPTGEDAPPLPGAGTPPPRMADRRTREPSVAADDRDGATRRRYSPVVRKMAAEHGIDLLALSGTGLGGRVTRLDVLAYLEAARPDVASPASEPASEPGTHPEVDRVTREEVLAYMAARPLPAEAQEPAPCAPRHADGDATLPLTAMRRGIAEHMVRSKRSAPHATTVTEVDMTRVVRWRAAHREIYRTRHGVEITYVAFVIQAVIEALREFPLLNASWGDDCIVLKRHRNIGIAVGLDDGLLVPVIHDADGRSLLGLSRAVVDLATRARAGRLTVQELQGGTFTVNNTGVFGSILSTPVINQPQAAILSMEAIVKRPVVLDDDAIAVRSMMNICLSFDHRIVDGLMAGRFNQRIRRHLEQIPLPSEP